MGEVGKQSGGAGDGEELMTGNDLMTTSVTHLSPTGMCVGVCVCVCVFVVCEHGWMCVYGMRGNNKMRDKFHESHCGRNMTSDI